ncbi:MAG: cell division protein FtsL [Treponema sp.]|nr:cell division protein FtsL [Treponema sp.]
MIDERAGKKGAGPLIKRYWLLYFFVFTIPFFLGFAAWQSTRYAELDKSVRHLEAVQEDWVENNKKLIAGIAVLSSSRRIEQVAVRDLKLSKLRPEDVLQVRIEGEEGR